MRKRRDWIALYELLGMCIVHFACHSRISQDQRLWLRRNLAPRTADRLFGQLSLYYIGEGKDIHSLLGLSAWKALHREAQRKGHAQWTRQNLPNKPPLS